MIDFRSDTVTKPSREMLEVMTKANVGDDEYGEDEEVNQLQDKCAEIFGMEAGLFVSSGVMGNQISISLHTNPGDEIICAEDAHIRNYEKGAASILSRIQIRPLPTEYGMFDPGQIQEALTNSNYHLPEITTVTWENTHLASGGSILDHSKFLSVSEYIKKEGLNQHLDGARVWHSIIENNINPVEIGQAVDSLTFCFSKGLGAPVGSMLLGSREFIRKARLVRKTLGGGMRQVGVLAAAAKFALGNRSNILKDHEKAKKIYTFVSKLGHPGIKNTVYRDTNMVFLHFTSQEAAQLFTENLANQNINVGMFSKNIVRLVAHLDITDEDLDILFKSLTKF